MKAQGSIRILKVDTSSIDPSIYDYDSIVLISSISDANLLEYGVGSLAIFIGDALIDFAGVFEENVVYQSTTARVVGAFNQSDWTPVLTKNLISENLNTFVDEVNNTIVPALEDQIDGKIEYWFNVSTDDPKNGWTVAERANRDGDVWYQVDTKKSYYYTSDNNSWNAITDKDAIQALQDAAEAKEAADNVIVSYYAWDQTLAPDTKYKWFKDDNTLWEHNGTTWVAVEAKEDDTLIAYNEASEGTKTFVYKGTNWVEITPSGIIANSKAVTDLKNYVTMDGHTAGGSTSLLQDLNTEISNGNTKVDSKFAYNSNLVIDGVSYNSGFGLTSEFIRNNDGTGSKESEFWINADKFKFTNTNNTGAKAPFTIDATGTSPEVTFNGRVSFTNVNNNPVSGNVVKFDWYATSDTLVDIEELGWTNYSGSGETYLSPNGLKIGNNSGNDQQWLIYNKSIPINPNKRYKVTVEAQQTAGTGTAYFGFAGRNYNDTLWVNSSGANSTSSQYYLIGSWDIPSTMTTKESSYWSVGGLVNGSDSSIRTDVVYYRPLILVNYSGKAGITTIKSFKLEELEATVDVSGDIGANNETFAQKLGYVAGTYNGTYYSTAWEMMKAVASSGQTVINGGHINTELIDAESITANQINTSGLIADNISTDTLVGKTIEGGVINGARINGAVIKASYLDLDGELEVLTNYHIPVSTYNANPSLYTDAVYIEVDNEYRIPSISTVKENTLSQNMVAGTVAEGNIYAYDVANVGHNSKAVKIRPAVTIYDDVKLVNYSAYMSDNYTVSFSGTTQHTLLIGGRSFDVEMYQSEFNMNTRKVDDSSYSHVLTIPAIRFNGSVVVSTKTVSVRNSSKSASLSTSSTYDFTVNGVNFRYVISAYGNTVSLYFNKSATLNAELYVISGSYTLANDFESAVLVEGICNSVGSNKTSNVFSLNSNILIDNMI